MDAHTYTPLFDGVVRAYGVVPAAIFGRVWRYAQMHEGVCRASQERIAQDLDLSRRTVIRWLAIFVETGRLVDLTPELVGLPHHYRVPDLLDFEPVPPVTESHTLPVTESHTPDPTCDTESQGVCQKVTPTCDTESLKERSLRDSLRIKNDEQQTHTDVLPSGEGSRKDEKPPKDKSKGKGKRRQAGAVRDPALDHPAVVGYREIARRNVPIAIRADVVSRVGDEPARLALWLEVVKGWVGSGYNPGNVLGMLNALDAGGLKKSGSGRSNENGNQPTIKGV